MIDQDPKLLTLLKWNRWNALIITISSLLCLISASYAPLILASIISFMSFFYSQRQTWLALKPSPGWANLLTSFRLIILLASIFLSSVIGHKTMAFVLILFLILDGFDGYLARKYKQETDFGKYLDMETDALFVCLMSLFLYFEQYFSWWIIIIGLLRYLNVMAEFLFVNKNALDPRLKVAVYIAVYLFIALLTPIFFDRLIHFPIVLSASILVSASFIYTFIFKIKNSP